MTETFVDWLRAELAADLDAAADKSTADWLIILVETSVAVAVLVRLSIAAGVWGLHYGEPESPLQTNPFGPPIDNDRWSTADGLEVALLCLLVLVFLSTSYDIRAFGEVTVGVAYVYLQIAAVVFEPIRVVWEIVR